MAGTAGPNLGLVYGFTDGDAWGSDMNANLKTLDALVNCSVVNQTTNAPPGSPAAGDRYVIGSSPTGAWAGHAKEVTRWNGTAWEFFGKKTGFLAYDEALAALYVYNGTTWAAV